MTLPRTFLSNVNDHDTYIMGLSLLDGSEIGTAMDKYVESLDFGGLKSHCCAAADV